MDSSPLISDLTSGELSPRLYGMSQQPVYHKGASVISNFVPGRQGGFFKRPGTLVLGHLSVAGSGSRLFPFVVDVSHIYVLIFSNNNIAVWKNNAFVANVVSTYTTAEIPSIQVYPFYPDLFIVQQNHAPARLRWTTPDTLTLASLTFPTGTITTDDTGATLTGNVTSGSNTITGVTTNKLPSQPHLVSGSSPTWLISGTGIPASTYIVSIAPTAGTNPVTYTLTLNNNGSATNAGVALTLTLQPLVFASSGNYPACVLVAQQRIWFANTSNNPQTVWQSIVGIWDPSDPVGTAGKVGMAWSDISTYSVPVIQLNADGTPTTNPSTFLPTASFQNQVNDADAGSYTINSDRSNVIYWIRNAQDIIVGSFAGEWIISANANPNTIDAIQISGTGDSNVPSTLITGGVIFVQRTNQRVYRLQWQGVNNPWQPPQDLTEFAEHLFKANTITAFDVQPVPDYLLWFLRSDGTAAVLVFDIALGTMAWWTFSSPGGVINSLCVVPGTDIQGIANDRDIVYMIVTRGATTFLEQVATPYWTDNRQAILSDCATYKYNAVKFTTMAVDTGLNGVTLEVVADGAYIGTAVPAAGVLTLPGALSANYAVAGINFVSRLTSMPLLSPQTGTQLQKSAIPKSRFRVYNTLYMKAGQFTSNTASGSTPYSNVKMGDTGIGGLVLSSTVFAPANPTMYSGYCRCSILEALRDDAYLTILSDLPLPCTVSAVVPDLVESESGR